MWPQATTKAPFQHARIFQKPKPACGSNPFGYVHSTGTYILCKLVIQIMEFPEFTYFQNKDVVNTTCLVSFDSTRIMIFFSFDFGPKPEINEKFSLDSVCMFFFQRKR